MRLLALPASSDSSTIVSGGFLPRMRAWLFELAPCFNARRRSRDQHRLPFRVKSAGVNEDAASSVPQRDGAVLAFPLNGHARLVRFAHDLKKPFVDLGLEDHHPLVLRVSGGSQPRLSIDASAYVEFRGNQLGYLVVFDDAFEARMTLETTDFEAVVSLVRAYISTRLTRSRDAQGAA